MRIIKTSVLKQFWEHTEYADSEGPLKAWIAEAKSAEWKNPAEVKAKYQTASVLKSGRVVFNVAGNKYRLVVWINYYYQAVLVKFIGTHKQYDEIDVESVDDYG